MEREKRQYPRARLNWPVSIHIDEEAFERATVNISPNGASICGLSPLELHEVVGLTVLSPDRPIKSKARVVWSRSKVPQGAGEDMPRGMGVEFIKISDEDRVFISSFISGLDFVVYLQSAAADEDEDRLLEVKLVGEQKEKEDNNNHAQELSDKKCPQGHQHVSWSADEDYLFCWDYNTWYNLPEHVSL